MNLVSYAQNQEDILLYRAFRGIEKGFYIDVGAQHPVADSVTKLFYERGWHGINIDPVPQWFELLCEDRPHDVNLRVAAGSVAGHEKFYAVAGTGLSTADAALVAQYAEAGYAAEELDVEIRTLDEICAEHGVSAVHFLKVDAEGAEEDVLRGFSFNLVRPWVVLVEAVAPVAMREGDDAHIAVETHAGWEPILIGHGYEYVYSDGLNRFYVAKEHDELKVLLQTQPNPLDAFIRHEELLKHQRILQLDAQVRELSDVAQVINQRSQIGDLQGLIKTAESRLHRIAELEQDNARLIGMASALQLDATELKDTHSRVALLVQQNVDLSGRLELAAQRTAEQHDRLAEMVATNSQLTMLLSARARNAVAGHKGLLRRTGFRFLKACMHFAERHPRLHTWAKAIYSRVPLVDKHLTAFVQHNSVQAKKGARAAPVSTAQAPQAAALGMPPEVLEVHQRIRRVIADQQHPKE